MLDLEEFYRRYLACCNERRLSDLSEYIHDEIRFNGQQTSRADYAAAIASNIAVVPDFRLTIEDLATSENLVAVRLSDFGTPQEEWLGLKPAAGR